MSGGRHETPLDTQAIAARLDARAPQGLTGRFPRRAWSDLTAALLVAAALVAWFGPLRHVDLRDMSAIGLLSVLPPPSLLGLGLLCVSFFVQLRRAPAPQPVLVLHVVALVVMLFAVTAVIEPEPRFAVAWRHVGIVSAIQETGVIRTTFDAYFNWPGFFAVSAFFAHEAGLSSLLPVTPWAPVAFELLALAPLLVIMRALTTNVRVQWSAIFIFYLANWVGQDYFSPQGFAYILYLIVIGVLLTWLRGSAPWRPPWARLRVVSSPHDDLPRLSPQVRGALVAITVLIMAAMISSHQLTPYALLPGVTALVLLRRCQVRGLPLIMAMMLAVWFCYMATGYLSGHLGTLVGGVGNVTSTLHQSVGSRVHGARGHVIVTTAQIVATAVLWISASLGAWLRARRGRDDVSALALAGGTLVLPFLQPYGGEILLRIFLFSLPFTSFFAAALFLRPSGTQPSIPTLVALAGFTLALAGVQLLVRYGNERMDWFSPAEVRVVQQLYAAAPAGSTLVAWSPSLPWKYRDYTKHHYRIVTGTPDWEPVARLPTASAAQIAALAARMRGQVGGAYLILTRSQAAQVDLTGISPRGTVERLMLALARSPVFRVIYADSDGAVFTIVHKRVLSQAEVEWRLKARTQRALAQRRLRAIETANKAPRSRARRHSRRKQNVAPLSGSRRRRRT